MKRIIENPNPEPQMEAECPYCGCKFEYTREDVWDHREFIAVGELKTFYSVKCPNCGKPFVIKGYVDNKGNKKTKIEALDV